MSSLDAGLRDVSAITSTNYTVRGIIGAGFTASFSRGTVADLVTRVKFHKDPSATAPPYGAPLDLAGTLRVGRGSFVTFDQHSPINVMGQVARIVVEAEGLLEIFSDFSVPDSTNFEIVVARNATLRFAGSNLVFGNECKVDNQGFIHIACETSTLQQQTNLGNFCNAGTIEISNPRSKATLTVDGRLENFLSGERYHIGGRIEVLDGGHLILRSDPLTPGSTLPTYKKCILGGNLLVGEGASLELGKNSKIGSSVEKAAGQNIPMYPTDVSVDGEIIIEPGITAPAPGQEAVDPRIRPVARPEGSGGGIELKAIPDPALCNIVGSLTLGSGTFSTTITRTGSSPHWAYTFGQYAIYGDVIINGGTLNVTESPSGTFNPIGVNFDIIWADHVKRTQAPTSNMANFTSFTGVASQYNYRQVITHPTPSPDPFSAVYRIKDTA